MFLLYLSQSPLDGYFALNDIFTPDDVVTKYITVFCSLPMVYDTTSRMYLSVHVSSVLISSDILATRDSARG